MSKGTLYRCSSCGHESTRWFGLCPMCKTGTGTEVDQFEEVPSTSAFQDQSVFKYNGPPVENLMKKVDPNEEPDVIVRTTKYPGLNAILSSGKGFVEAQVILLGASPGVGKSTLCMSIADEGTLYISSEENYKQVNQRALRVNPDCGCTIMNVTGITETLEAIHKWNGDLIVIDSLNAIEFGVGYATVAKFANEITKAVKERNKVCILISQVTRAGEITGMNSIIHIVDTVMHLERSEVSNNVIAVSSKNRFGEVGSVAVFQHKADGFVEIDVDHMQPEVEVGATYTETRFGHKMMTVAIEALVAESQAAYGLRKANGYNGNRLVQLVGILSYYGRLDLVKKDIYVQVSNGLWVDDVSIELAMANSILSSYYGKTAVQKASGEIRLNGKVSNGYIDGKEIKHISELIEMYR